jgi:hypothetical protein
MLLLLCALLFLLVCRCGLSELAVQQCHCCKNVYCSSCSVINYDAREDRVFCLDCLPGTVGTLLLLAVVRCRLLTCYAIT